MTEQKKSIKEDLLFLFLKIVIFVMLLAIMFFFVFGIYRCSDNMMTPAVKDGDLAVYYRLQKEFKPSDIVIVEKNGETEARRMRRQRRYYGRGIKNQWVSAAGNRNLYGNTSIYRRDFFSSYSRKR